jgi:hypothetical protein
MNLDVPTVDTFGSTRDRKITVKAVPGFLANVELCAKIELPHEATWRLLTHEDNYKIFRSMKVRLHPSLSAEL